VEPFVLETRVISNGAARLTLELFPPFQVEESGAVDGEAFNVDGQDIHIEARVEYLTNILGGTAGALVPYLRLSVEITNEDNGRKLRADLVPLVSIQRGLTYARNLAVLSKIGKAQSHYSVELAVVRPARFGAVDTEPFSSGIVLEDGLHSQTAGTFLGEVATVLQSHFSLDDLDGTGASIGDGGTGSRPPEGSSGGYIPP
jgi:hypothetical protein